MLTICLYSADLHIISIYIIYIYIVDLKVHVEIVYYKGRQVPTWDPAKVVSEFAKVICFWANDLAKDCLIWDPRES
jgi:hypothetical protein